MKIIFTAGSNRKYAERALKAGMLYGARLPVKVYFPPYFVDQEWLNPNRVKYMDALAEHRPAIATVLDLEYPHQFDEVLSWAEEAARWVSEAVIIIPKVDLIEYIPRFIAGKEIRLGYSVPTRFGGTPIPYQYFKGWPVHLLGGSPEQHLAYAQLLNVISADTNKIMEQAGRNQVWQPHPIRARNRRYPQLKEIGLGHLDNETCYEALERSCQNYVEALESGKWSAQLPLF